MLEFYNDIVIIIPYDSSLLMLMYVSLFPLFQMAINMYGGKNIFCISILCPIEDPRHTYLNAFTIVKNVSFIGHYRMI